jgi:hypothetical protein
MKNGRTLLNASTPDVAPSAPGAAHAASANASERAARGPRLEYQALGLAVFLGALVYGSYLASSGGFPLNDGGLFYAMARDIQRAHYALPRYTSYDPQIPFAYPPLGLYAAAVVSGLLHVSALTVLWLLPALVTLATIPVFFLLARRLLSSAQAVSVAVLAYALLPGTFMWRIMGGGITRSFGYLFALLAIYFLLRLCAEGSGSMALWSGVCAGLTLLSHPEASTFLGLSALLLLAWYGRRARVWAWAVASGALALVVASPWLLTVLHRFGPAPFLSGLNTNGNPMGSLLYEVVLVRVGNEPLFPLVAALGLLGMVALGVQRRWLLPVWLVAEVLVDSRGGGYFAVVPLCLAAGVGVADALVPAFAGLLGRRGGASDGRLGGSRAARLLLGLAILYALINALSVSGGAPVSQGSLGTLGRQDRAAMAWVAGHTPSDSRFLIVPVNASGISPAGLFWTDRRSEWFPALSGRRSVVTVQGREWVGDFRQTIADYGTLQQCVEQNVRCLESWSASTGRSFDYIYLPNVDGPAGQPCCQLLRQSLGDSPDYTRVYDGPGATIYRRAAGPPDD